MKRAAGELGSVTTLMGSLAGPTIHLDRNFALDWSHADQYGSPHAHQFYQKVFFQPLRSRAHPTELEELVRLRQERPRTLGFPAEAVLMSARRLPIPGIMRQLGVSRPTVTGWLTRFERSGLAPRPRSGRPPKLTSDVLRHIGRRFPASRARDEWGGLDPPHTQGSIW